MLLRLVDSRQDSSRQGKWLIQEGQNGRICSTTLGKSPLSLMITHSSGQVQVLVNQPNGKHNPIPQEMVEVQDNQVKPIPQVPMDNLDIQDHLPVNQDSQEHLVHLDQVEQLLTHQEIT